MASRDQLSLSSVGAGFCSALRRDGIGKVVQSHKLCSLNRLWRGKVAQHSIFLSKIINGNLINKPCPDPTLLGSSNHTLDLLRQMVLVVGDHDAVRLSSCLVGGGDVQDTIGVDIKGNLDLRDTAGSRRDTRELELFERVVVLGAGTLTLVNLDEYTRLVVGIGGEDFSLLCRDRSVSLDESSHDTTSGLDTEGKGATSSKSKPWVFSEASPERMATSTAAP